MGHRAEYRDVVFLYSGDQLKEAKMQITYFSGYKDTCVNTSENLTWAEIVEQFSEHQIQTEKDGMMFNLIKFKDPTYKRCSDNVEYYDGLILDYDGKGATIESIIQRFYGFCHLGYTSYNHIINDEGVEKFRIVLPFETPCPFDEWDERKENFLEFAGEEIDTSSVSHSRSFYMPACPTAGVKYKDFWSAEGTLLDWRMFIPDVKPLHQHQHINIPLAVTDLQKALDELKRHVHELPYDLRCRVAWAVATHIGVNEAIKECRSRWPDANLNGKYEVMLRRIQPGRLTIGSIIKEIQKYNKGYQVLTKEEYKLAALQQKLQNKYGDYYGI